MILVIVLFVLLAALVGPLVAYSIGRSRAARRNDAALAQFIAKRKNVLRDYYWVGAATVGVYVLGICLNMTVFSNRVARSTSNALFCSGALFFVVLSVFGLVLIVTFLKAGKEPVPGYCAKCDYDLRGTVGERCPECGRSIQLSDE